MATKWEHVTSLFTELVDGGFDVDQQVLATTVRHVARFDSQRWEDALALAVAGASNSGVKVWTELVTCTPWIVSLAILERDNRTAIAEAALNHSSKPGFYRARRLYGTLRIKKGR
eukprot:CAMPEP_0178457174 /NCGR_PEP_ID=MMETSP0689_2-20121128/46880_1 /TAXON_ID=160604 /ORGANISM="Amphidinium massartii, Strain CS-259" /LENGTH=114 /DNA_ID=CAMNT_0020083415 /DNA_START=174 /DNA_END=515 /DNA_ORIENTATION=-